MAGPFTTQQAQLTLVFSGTGMPQGGVCTIGFITTESEINPGSLDVLVNLIKPVHQATSCDNVTLASAELKRGPNESGPTWVETVNQNGTRGQGTIAPNTCVLVHKTLLDLSNKFAGRLFWPGPPEVVIDQGGNLTPSYVDDVTNAWQAFSVATDAAGLHACVFHGPESLAPDYTLIDRFVVSGLVATQRRRLRR